MRPMQTAVLPCPLPLIGPPEEGERSVGHAEFTANTTQMRRKKKNYMVRELFLYCILCGHQC